MQLGDQKQKDFYQKFKDFNRQEEEAQAAKKAVELGVEYINLAKFPIDLNAISLLTPEQSQQTRSGVFYKDGNDLRIGTEDPNNPELLAFIDELAKKHLKPKLYFISHSSLVQIQEFYQKIPGQVIERLEFVEVKDQDYIKLLPVLADESKTYTATQILEYILGAADQYKSSDIHIEPEEHIVKIRLRLDGVLTDVLHLPKTYQKPLNSRIKIFSKMKLNVEDIPQDGRFTFKIKGAPTDVRVSTLPSAYGESTVLRLLGTQAVNLKLDDLGFTGRSYEIIKHELEKPNGMIITTGPTGSGKTTTLYAFLNQLNEPGVKIITLEDPVEYKLEGIIQTPISADKGLTFAAGLRSILRQDPDVIMVGEIRDQETAETGLQAALTGHIVLSTLHTNDAAGAIPRLINMGVKPFVIAPAMNAIIAQRLVRRLCPDCKEEAQLETSLMQRVTKILGEIPKAANVELPKELKFYHSKGCDKCNHLMYRGRIGVYEVIEKTDALEKLILAGASTGDIKKNSISEGMVTMTQDGLLKALQGITDVEEVFRVTEG